MGKMLAALTAEILKIDGSEDFRVSYDETQNCLVFAFKGTTCLSRWVTNFQIGDLFGFHKGFFMKALHFFAEVEAEISKHCDEKTTIIFTGHSSGGAIAIISCFLAQSAGIKNCYAYSFGAPKINRDQNRKLENVLEVTNSGDLVPNLPAVGGFFHCGETHSLDGKFQLSIDFLKYHTTEFYHFLCLR